MQPIIIVDTREQTPLAFPKGIETRRASLPTGDYAPAGYENQICVERKSLPDAIASVRSGRSRFQREWERMSSMHACVLIVATSEAFEANASGYPGVIGTYQSWSSKYRTPVVFQPAETAGDWIVGFFQTTICLLHAHAARERKGDLS